MPAGIAQDGGIDQGWPRVNKAVVVVAGDLETEGYCPMGDFGCPGLVNGQDGKSICGLADHPDASLQVARCNARREARG